MKQFIFNIKVVVHAFTCREWFCRVDAFIFLRYLMWKYGSIPIRDGPYVVGWSQSVNQFST